MGSALLSYEQALHTVAQAVRRLRNQTPRAEQVPLALAQGRVLARQIVADCDQPPFARSTRDGFACRAVEANTHEPLHLVGSTHAGEAPAGPLAPGSAWEIMTGAPVPDGADAVMMIEHADVSDGRVRLLSPRALEQGENIVARGAQALQGDALVPAGAAIGFHQIALAASCGYAHLSVYARPKVAILATGDELVPVDALPGPGKIRNSNAPMLAALVAAAGGDPWVLPAAADTDESLDEALKQAKDADLLILSGGVSAGKFDLVEPALARLGATFHFTGIRIQPGKPLVFGEIPRATNALPLFGLPGNPISSAVTYLLFAAPVLAALCGRAETGPRFALAQLAANPRAKAKSLNKPGLTRFLPAHCDFNASTESLPSVMPIPMQGSGDLAALARCNCFIVVPEQSEATEAGATVRIVLHP